MKFDSNNIKSYSEKILWSHKVFVCIQTLVGLYSEIVNVIKQLTVVNANAGHCGDQLTGARWTFKENNLFTQK